MYSLFLFRTIEIILFVQHKRTYFTVFNSRNNLNKQTKTRKKTRGRGRSFAKLCAQNLLGVRNYAEKLQKLQKKVAEEQQTISNLCQL
jgi:hypothetical protein